MRVPCPAARMMQASDVVLIFSVLFMGYFWHKIGFNQRKTMDSAMVKLKAVLFDLDGTLLDSAHDIAQGLNKMLVDEGRRALDVEQIKPMLGYGAMELCQKALDATGGCTDDDLFPYVQKIITHYRKVEPDPAQIFPGAREALERFKSKGIKMGICTNKADAAMHSVLDALELSSYFGYMAGGDTFMVHKPNPGHVTGVLDELGVATEAAIFIGDGPADVAASQGAGMKCIVMTHGYGVEFDKLGADLLLDSYAGLVPAINKLGFEV